MQISFIAFEILMIALFIICFFHAFKRGKVYIAELTIAAVYGVILEIFTMIQMNDYYYGDFFLKVYNAPIAIGLGWAIIIYTAMATADRLGVVQKVRPFIVALLALNIDISMDPIAIREGFWIWGDGVEPKPWFGVPLGNFFAWFIVTFSFSYFIYYFRKNKKLQKIYPFLAMILSVVILMVLDGLWVFALTQPLRIFILAGILLFSISYIYLNKGFLKTDNKFDWKILSIPIALNLFFLGLLLNGKYYTPALASSLFLMLSIGLYIHLLPSLDAAKRYMGLNVGEKKPIQ